MKKFFLLALVLTNFAEAQTTTPEIVPTNVVTAPAPTPTPAVSINLQSISFSGDFRYRLQSETQEPKEARKLQRLQARLQAVGEVQDNLKVTLRLMTGSAANSGNQTLGDEKNPGMVRRNFGLDQAFFDYKAFSFWNLYGGKMPQPFTFVGKNQLLLDRDITLEGLGTKFKIPLEQEFSLIIQGGTFVIRENYDSLFSEDLSDNMFNGGQLAVQWKKDNWDITAGYGTFAFTGLKDTPPVNLTTGAGANGNTLDLSGNYPANFDIDEYFLEVKKKINDFDLSVFYEALNNKDIEALNKASAYGMSVGYKKWTLSWIQENVEKDAVVGLFTDSDFAGGLTSSKGTVTSLNYKITDKVQVQYTVYANKNSVDTTAAKYDRTHFDLLMNF